MISQPIVATLGPMVCTKLILLLFCLVIYATSGITLTWGSSLVRFVVPEVPLGQQEASALVQFGPEPPLPAISAPEMTTGEPSEPLDSFERMFLLFIIFYLYLYIFYFFCICSLIYSVLVGLYNTLQVLTYSIVLESFLRDLCVVGLRHARLLWSHARAQFHTGTPRCSLSSHSRSAAR